MKIEKYLQASPFAALSAATERAYAYLEKKFAEEEVTFNQGLILTALFFEGEKETHPSDLAAAFGMSRGNLSHLIAGLEERKLIAREVDRTDSRRFILRLRPEGRKLALQLVKSFDRLQDDIEKSFGAGSCGELSRLLRKFRDTVDR